MTAIDETRENDIIYDYIYDNIIDACVEAIENGEYNYAYDKYKNSILSLKKTFLGEMFQSEILKDTNLVYV